MMVSSEIWRCSSRGGDALLPSRYVSSLTGKQGSYIDYADRKITSWKPTRRILRLDTSVGGDFVQIQDNYAIHYRDYDIMRDRFRAGMVHADKQPMLVDMLLLCCTPFYIYC